MIVKPEKMDFSNKHLIVIVSGLPGTGKSTLALSAKNALLIDTDNGMCRVKPEHRRDASICSTYEEVLADVKEAVGQYETIIIDTCGSLIDYMKDWAMRTDPKASKTNGGFSVQGYGVIKQEFLRLSAELRKNFNVIYIFHESITKQDDGIFYELVVEGSTRTTVYQPADLAGHMFIQNGKRRIGWTPTDQYTAKSAYGIRGIMDVPELGEGDANNFMEKLFEKVRANLAADAGTKETQEKAYKEVMDYWANLMNDVTEPVGLNASYSAWKIQKHALTSKEECKKALLDKAKVLGCKFDKKTQQFVYADEQKQ